MFLSEAAIEKLRDAVKQTENDRERYEDYGAWIPPGYEPPLVTVLITGPIDPATGLYPAVTSFSPTNHSWEEGLGQILIKPANPDDVFIIGRRYLARPSHADDSLVNGTGTDAVYATDVFIGYSSGSDTIVTGTGTGTQDITFGGDVNITLINDADITINQTGDSNLIINVPTTINNEVNVNNNFIGLMNIIPPVNAVKNPLQLPGPGMFFRMKVNLQDAPILGLAPGAVNDPGRMLGIINAGPQRAKWRHRWSDNPAYNVRTPDGTAYFQSINELLFIYSDGSSEEWVLAAHRDLPQEIGTGTGTGSAGGEILDPPPCSTSETYTFAITGTTDMNGTYSLTWLSDEVWSGGNGDNGFGFLNSGVAPVTLQVQFGIFFPPKSATYECLNFSCGSGGLFTLVSTSGESETWPSTINVTNP